MRRNTTIDSYFAVFLYAYITVKQLSYVICFNNNVLQENSCLHHLLPPPRLDLCYKLRHVKFLQLPSLYVSRTVLSSLLQIITSLLSSQACFCIFVFLCCYALFFILSLPAGSAAGSSAGIVFTHGRYFFCATLHQSR